MDKSPLERAFEIARTGACETVEEIRRQLAREGYDWRQLEGRTLTRQLRDMLRKARELA